MESKREPTLRICCRFNDDGEYVATIISYSHKIYEERVDLDGDKGTDIKRA